jgi:hypothetical protein
VSVEGPSVRNDVPGVGRPDRVPPAPPGARNWQRRQRRPAAGGTGEGAPPPSEVPEAEEDGGETPDGPEHRVDIVV